MRYKIIFSYDGSKFDGYATQTSKNTVQDNIQEILTKINKKEVKIYASGRTDKGVHANYQVAHFDLDINITTNGLKMALNSHLKPYIYIRQVKRCTSNFHARFDVKSKTYEYQINMGKYNPIKADYIYQYNNKLNINNIIKATKYLIGEHNFKAFTKSDDIKDSYTRTIYNIEVKQTNNILKIKFTGTGFMRYQIRNMVGTLIEVGSGKRKPNEIAEILECQDRKKAGKTSPACGLYLKKVEY